VVLAVVKSGASGASWFSHGERKGQEELGFVVVLNLFL